MSLSHSPTTSIRSLLCLHRKTTLTDNITQFFRSFALGRVLNLDKSEEQFQQLKFLGLEELNIKQWEASSINFPCLEELQVRNCVDVEEIPLELGDISTLEYIYVFKCGASLLVSLQKIRQEQDDMGNYELAIIIDGRKMPSCVPNHDS
ncbi:unnamed protein product [Lactuca virosa]|uniref:Uncharacterized protein n=1 Tax=Lactuca virosa TaxID=75947 RepID=A0AAU9PD35_9ASTR|nr:unnamed protein product [Lactuca virosa]